MRPNPAPLLVLLSACADPEAYLDELATAQCALYERCGYLSYLGAQDAAACEEVVALPACEALDRAAGDACLEGLDALTCEAYAAGDWPAACDAACEGG